MNYDKEKFEIEFEGSGDGWSHATLVDYHSNGDENVEIPENVTRIGQAALCAKAGLKNLTIPGNVRVIEDHACVSCSDLEMVMFEKPWEDEDKLVIESSAFAYCSKLHTVFLCDNIKYLGEGAFSGSGIAYKEGLTIYFDGTKAKWLELDKSELDIKPQNCKVCCSDGQLIWGNYKWIKSN